MNSNPHIVNFYIDAFNFYHRISDYQKQTGICLKWLDYQSLCQSFLKEGQSMGKVYFFTATTDHFGKEVLDRHNKYITALSFTGVEVIRGYFKKDFKTGKLEEKKTDCNIVAKLLEDAFCGNFHTAFILSADSDIVPAIEVIKRNPQTKSKIILVAPPPFEGKRIHYNKLAEHNISNFIQICDGKKRIKFKHLSQHLLPQEVKSSSGKMVVMPIEYTARAN
jgi:uncharacterized LabA/DUF88 family protein